VATYSSWDPTLSATVFFFFIILAIHKLNFGTTVDEEDSQASGIRFEMADPSMNLAEQILHFSLFFSF